MCFVELKTTVLTAIETPIEAVKELQERFRHWVRGRASM